MARSVYRTAAPNFGTMSPLMRERATARQLGMIEVGLDDLKKAAKTVDVTVNDAYLAAVTGGLRRYTNDTAVPSGPCGPSCRSASAPSRTRTGATGSPCSG